MINIRHGCYETNSSSCHSICISKIPVNDYRGQTISFQLDDFGWSEETYFNTEDYLYTIIVCENTPENVEKYLNKLKKILDECGVRYTFEPYKVVHANWGDYCTCEKSHGWGIGVDHGDEAMPMVNALLNDKDMLMRFLFGDSVIYTGNDNYCEADSKCFSACDSYYNDDDQLADNPNHRPDKYDYFYKGN